MVILASPLAPKAREPAFLLTLCLQAQNTARYRGGRYLETIDEAGGGVCYKGGGGAGFSPLENQAGSRGPRRTLLREHLGPPRPSGEVGASTGRSLDGNWRQPGVRMWAELN